MAGGGILYSTKPPAMYLKEKEINPHQEDANWAAEYHPCHCQARGSGNCWFVITLDALSKKLSQKAERTSADLLKHPLFAAAAYAVSLV